MSHDIHDILRRLAAVTDGPAHHDRLVEDLSAQQRSVKQLPALFKPPQTSPQLSGPYPGQNATRGYLVGEDEEVAEGDVVAFSRAGMTTVKDQADYIDKRDKIFRLLSQPGTDAQTRAAAKAQLKTLELAARNAGIMTEESDGDHRASLAETMAEIEEDMLSRVKKDLNAYLDRLGEKISDDGRRERDTPQLDKLARKQKIDRELLLKAVDAIEKRKAEESLDENDYELSEPETLHAVQDKIDVAAGQPQKPIQVMEIAPGKTFEVYEMGECDYEIRHSGRPMKSRFSSASDADVALKLFKAHHDRTQRSSAADYIEER